jgi:hypothetical protein
VYYTAPDNLLSLRNVLVHMLSPGKFSYDLISVCCPSGPRLNQPGQGHARFQGVDGAEKAGPLIVTGDLSAVLRTTSSSNAL